MSDDNVEDRQKFGDWINQNSHMNLLELAYNNWQKAEAQEAERDKLRDENERLQEAAQAVVDTVNVHSLSRNSVTKASLVALAALLDKGEKDG